MKDPHDLIWKFWASERMAHEIWERSIISTVELDDEFWLPKGLAQILKKEWFR